MSDRTQLTTGLRQFADWLETHPDVTPPRNPRFLLPLSTNQAVVDFAAEHGLTTTADTEGNLSASLVFGSVTYEAYGYVDFATHLAAREEKDARDWADQHGLQITPRADTCARCKRPFDPADTRFDGLARFDQTEHCRGCVSRCHDAESADHRCVICA